MRVRSYSSTYLLRCLERARVAVLLLDLDQVLQQHRARLVLLGVLEHALPARDNRARSCRSAPRTCTAGGTTPSPGGSSRTARRPSARGRSPCSAPRTSRTAASR